MPKRFRRLLAGHEVRTAFEAGLADVQNGLLLAIAAVDFELVITLDQRLVHQQNLKELPIAVLVLVVPNNSWEVVRQFGPLTLQVVPNIPPRTLVQLFLDGRSDIATQ
jgi:hypothetical protein